MMTRSFSTSCEAKVGIKLPELNPKAHISEPSHVNDQKSNYDVIFGKDILRKLGMSLDFQNNFVGWKET